MRLSQNVKAQLSYIVWGLGILGIITAFAYIIMAFYYVVTHLSVLLLGAILATFLLSYFVGRFAEWVLEKTNDY